MAKTNILKNRFEPESENPCDMCKHMNDTEQDEFPCNLCTNNDKMNWLEQIICNDCGQLFRRDQVTELKIGEFVCDRCKSKR